MGEYVYTLKGPKKNINVDINGEIHSVALLSYHYKPTYNWDKPRWQILAEARCQRMDNIWKSHGMPKYVVHVFIEDDGTIKFEDVQVFEWPIGTASISDYSNVYEKRKHVGYLSNKVNKVWKLK